MPIKLGPTLISVMVILAFMAAVVLLLVKPIDLKDNAATILNVLLGALSAKFGDVVAYHIGSSAGSKEKSDMLAKIQDKP